MHKLQRKSAAAALHDELRMQQIKECLKKIRPKQIRTLIEHYSKDALFEVIDLAEGKCQYMG